MRRSCKLSQMKATAPLYESKLDSLQLVARGKVRDIYKVDSRRLLIVATDRISAFDVVLPDPVPDKGRVLTAISNFWFEHLKDIVPNHLTGIEPEESRQLPDRVLARPETEASTLTGSLFQ